LKEVEHYKDEVKVNERKVDEMKRDASKDVYDVKRYEDILNESYMMVPDATKRLEAAITDLCSYISNMNSALDSSGTWYQAAQEIVQQQGCPNDVVEADYNMMSNSTHHVLETRIDDLADGEAF
jgi:tubulin-specific chaperone A